MIPPLGLWALTFACGFVLGVLFSFVSGKRLVPKEDPLDDQRIIEILRKHGRAKCPRCGFWFRPDSPGDECACPDGGRS